MQPHHISIEANQSFFKKECPRATATAPQGSDAHTNSGLVWLKHAAAMALTKLMHKQVCSRKKQKQQTHFARAHALTLSSLRYPEYADTAARSHASVRLSARCNKHTVARVDALATSS